MKSWYVNDYGKKELEPSDLINLSYMDLTELVLPDGVKEVWCRNNQLNELIIPDQVEYISCKGNNLTELIVPDHCIVDCDNTVKVITRTMHNRSNRLKAILK
jgi:hypothetical protein